ncbi:MAG: MFS transporter [Candidatus Velthaea sp.]|jgi:predicted MFS family arabinose efflux permease
MKARFHPAYAITAGTAFVFLISSAAVRSAPTMMIVPLEKEFGWSAATISLALAINIGLFGLVGPFAAAVFERFGLRRTVAGAFALLALAAGLSSLMGAPWQLVLLWGFMVGLGTGGVGLIVGATIVNRWFDKGRGTVMGLLTASNATGQLLFLPLFGLLVSGPGWRAEVLAVSLVCALLVPLALFALREYPSDIGLPRYGSSTVTPPVRSAENPFGRALVVLRDGARSRDFWLLGGTFLICGASTNGLIGTHLVPACGDHGIPEVRAAGLLATMGVFDLLGTTASGWLADRYSSRLLLMFYYGLRGLSLIFLPQAFGIAAIGLPIFAVWYGLDWIATVPPTLKLATDAFGRERSALIFGWVLAGHQLGAALAAGFAGLVRTYTLSYDGAFISSGVLCLCAAVLVLFIGRGRAVVPVPTPA